MKGTVLRSTGSWYEVMTTEGNQVKARLRGKFRQKGLKFNNPVAVGDLVDMERELGEENTFVIHAISPRQNHIIRQSTHKSGHAHIIAANIDQALLIVTLARPRTSLGFIDRFLVTAEAYHIPTTLVFNKTDIYGEGGMEELSELKALYGSLGYGILFTSATVGEGLDAFKELLISKTTLLSGHSGVGKSTLVNAIMPGLDLKTAEISDFANKGVHTTTFATMHPVPTLGPRTFIIDTPGIKELGLMDMDNEQLSHYFPEMRALVNQCRFHNCTHVHEPGCAVQDAIEEGIIATSRYLSYLSMLEKDDNRR